MSPDSGKSKELGKESDIPVSGLLSDLEQRLNTLFGQLANDEGLDENRRHDLAHMLQIVATYIHMSRQSDADQASISRLSALLSSGELLLDPGYNEAESRRPVELGGLIQGAELYLREAVRDEVELEVSLVSQPVYLLADPTQIHRILINLVKNANRAILSTGKVTVSLKTEGSSAILSVSDTGIGMDEDTLKVIFESRFTSDAGRGGSGLGLTSVNEIVTSLGGKIDVQSQKGAGSTFRIELPLGARKVVRPLTDAIAPQKKGAEEILVVDDDLILRRMMKRVLELDGFKVFTAKDGEGAMETLEEKDIALALSDLRLGSECGVLLAQRMQEKAHLPVILNSGDRSCRQLKGLNGEGAVRFIPKPFDSSRLAGQIREMIAKKRRQVAEGREFVSEILIDPELCKGCTFHKG
ncbi:MAG: ATP-binding protein [Candidatus Peregrinibacteria bacterium]|nr:ATP-binding protein [Candidatus Peregrinibacteria bacterium]